MAITKTIIVDKTEVVSIGSTYSSDEWKNVQVRTATVIKEDGVELNRSFNRHVLTPGKQYVMRFGQIQLKKHID